MKIFKLVSWFSIGLAVLFILITGICFVLDLNLLGVRHIVNFLHTANSFLLLAIAVYLVTDKFQCCDQNKQ